MSVYVGGFLVLVACCCFIMLFDAGFLTLLSVDLNLLFASAEPLNTPSIAFKNPLLMQANVSNEDVIFSVKNRCALYPRCLLFECCDENLQASVRSYFEQVHNDRHSTPRSFTQDSTIIDNSIDNTTLMERLTKLPLFSTTLTRSLIADGIASLPPTHPKAYRALESSSCHFRILYLVQGESKARLPVAYSSMKDMILLNYKGSNRVDGELYFPNSTFSTGRMALYLIARQLELSQGWLYNYFVFADDDADFQRGSIQLYEQFLAQWRPAIGVPGFKKYPRREVEAVVHVDFIFKGYHRETVEVLMPWVLDFDQSCIWASQLVQMIEANMVYRNHILATTAVYVTNKQHRAYAKYGCPGVTGAFANAIHDLHAQAPNRSKHCTIKELYQDFYRLFLPGSSSGIARPKLTDYHLIVDPSSFNSTYSVHNFNRHNHNYPKSLSFPSSSTSTSPPASYALSCSKYETFHPDSPLCCSVDEEALSLSLTPAITTHLNAMGEKLTTTATYHNKVITHDNSTYYFMRSDVKHIVPKKFLPLIGFDVETVLYVPNAAMVDALLSSRLTKLSAKCPSLFPDLTVVQQ